MLREANLGVLDKLTIVALANVLMDGVAQRWGMANPHIEAVGSLLHDAAAHGPAPPTSPGG